MSFRISNRELNTVEDYRRRFNTATLGIWSAASGTFNIVMDQIWEFFADHTGRITEESVLFGEQQIRFRWREHGERTILFGIVSDPDPEEQAENKDEEPFYPIRYDFKVVETDCGSQIGMYDIEGGANYFGLRFITAPLAYHGDANRNS